MPIVLERQKRLLEVGIIRVGDPKPNEKQPGRPRSTFRLTSRHKHLLEAAKDAYGGELREWAGHPGQYELLTVQPTIKALFSMKEMPDGDLQSLSQWYEQWEGNNCTHRCDGRSCHIWKGEDRVTVGCQCEPDARKCKLVSRVSLILSEVPALGLWRLNTGSKIFDQEINSLVETIDQLGLSGLVPVTLTIVTREMRTGPDKPTKKLPVVEVALDPNPVSLPAMVGRIRQAALAPASLGEVPAPALPSALEPPEPCDGENVLTVDPPNADVCMEAELVGQTDGEWAVELIGLNAVRDWRSAFEGAGLDFDQFIMTARANGVDADKFSLAAQKKIDHSQGGS